MKKLITITILALSLSFSFKSFSMDAYTTADEGIKKMISQMFSTLNIPRSIENEKKIYNSISYIWDGAGSWNGYWLGYNELASSKIKDPDITFIEYFFNTENNGIYFLSLQFDTRINQMLISTKQLRYGTKKAGLDKYLEEKANTEKYELKHERDKYALLQEAGKVNFSAYHLSSNEGMAVYFNQRILDF